jgi:hypothetical protein
MLGALVCIALPLWVIASELDTIIGILKSRHK